MLAFVIPLHPKTKTKKKEKGILTFMIFLRAFDRKE